MEYIGRIKDKEEINSPQIGPSENLLNGE